MLKGMKAAIMFMAMGVAAAMAAPLSAYPLHPDIVETFNTVDAGSSGSSGMLIDGDEYNGVYSMGWLTRDITAFRTYHNSAGGDGSMCYYEKMSELLEDYLIFYPSIDPELGMEERMVGPLTIEGVPTLTTDQGITVKAVHPETDGYLEFHEISMIFPNKDADGNDVITDKTKSITVTVKYKERKVDEVFTWKLPLERTKLMDKADAWLEKMLEKKSTYCEDNKKAAE